MDNHFTVPIPQINPVVRRLLELGISKAEMGRAAGTSRQNVSGWALGIYQPKPEHLEGLNNLLIQSETSQERKTEIKRHQDQIYKLLKSS